jgi:beta-lactamase class D
MRVYISQFGYGNRNIGGNEDSFWLDGKLRISALQQVEFLERFYIGKLPVHPKNAGIVKDIMFLEKIGNAILRGKTGWIPSGDDKIGWLVGWVERGEEAYIFALNLDPNEEKHVAARVSDCKIAAGATRCLTETVAKKAKPAGHCCRAGQPVSTSSL